jgi:hypothetical protein
VILVVKFPFLSVIIVSVEMTAMECRGSIFSASHSNLIAAFAVVFLFPNFVVGLTVHSAGFPLLSLRPKFTDTFLWLIVNHA